MDSEALERHRRHILIKEIGGPGVAKLRAASVSLVGAGALGGPAALYLAAAGVGEIELWDDDAVELSNLQRQIQFDTSETGAPKAERLADRLQRLHPGTHVLVRQKRWSANDDLTGKVLIDATDNYETRFDLNAKAHASARALVSGAAIGWTGQVSVFASGLTEKSPCYRCLVPELPPEPADCSTVGVVGPVTGIVGARMALESLKLITGAGDVLIGQLWRMDGLRGEARTVKLRPDPECPTCRH